MTKVYWYSEALIVTQCQQERASLVSFRLAESPNGQHPGLVILGPNDFNWLVLRYVAPSYKMSACCKGLAICPSDRQLCDHFYERWR